MLNYASKALAKKGGQPKFDPDSLFGAKKTFKPLISREMEEEIYGFSKTMKSPQLN